METAGSEPAGSEPADELAKPVEPVDLPKVVENDGYDPIGDAEDDTCFCFVEILNECNII